MNCLKTIWNDSLTYGFEILDIGFVFFISVDEPVQSFSLMTVSDYEILRPVCLVVSVSASHALGRGFAPRPGHTKDHLKNGTNCLPAYRHASVHRNMHLKDLFGSITTVGSCIPVSIYC